MSTPWKIARRARACAACAKAFGDGESHFSALRFDEGLRRFDRCVDCFRASPPGTDEFYWRTQFAADGKRRLAVDIEALREAFVRMEPSPATIELRYVVSLLLLRKRVLRLLETRRGEGEEPDALVLTMRKGGGEGIVVPIPTLSSERVERLKGELRSLLGLEEASEGAPATDSARDPAIPAEGSGNPA